MEVDVKEKEYVFYDEPKTKDYAYMVHVHGEHVISRIVLESGLKDAPLEQLKENVYKAFNGILDLSPVVDEKITQMVLLPCLQEIKKWFIEQEQQPGYWDPFEQKMYHLTSKEPYGFYGSSLFNKYWTRPEKDDETVNKNKPFGIDNQIVKKQGILKIPYFEGFSSCKTISRTKKWALYTRYFMENMKDNDGVFIITTHHNKMRDKLQGILPILKDVDEEDKPRTCAQKGGSFPYFFKKKKKKKGYANLFILRISFEMVDGNVTFHYEVLQRGFPDKGSFENSDTSDDKYTYIENYEDIDFEEIEAGIKEGLKGYANKRGHILMVRHANAGHNDPTNCGFYERLDSITTPLGITQALCAGSYGFECNIQSREGTTTYKSLGEFLHGKQIIPACSFLQRTQHTCLLLLHAAGVQLSNPMLKSLRYLNNQAQIRFIGMGKQIDSFMDYSPLKEKDENVEKIFYRVVHEMGVQMAIQNQTLFQYLAPHKENDPKVMDDNMKKYQTQVSNELECSVIKSSVNQTGMLGGRTRRRRRNNRQSHRRQRR